MIEGFLKQKGNIVKVVQDDFPNKDSKVLVDVYYCGICGTDYQKYIGMDTVSEWGHEIIGKIHSQKDGNLVTIRTTYPCGKCMDCNTGHFEKCQNWSRLNMNGFANQVCVDEKSIIDLGVKKTDVVFSLVEPLYVAHSLIQHVHPTCDAVYSVIGNGTIGLLTAFLLRKKYEAEVRVVGRRNLPKRKKFIEEIGASYYSFDDLEKALKDSNKIIITTPYHTIPNILKVVDSYSFVTFNGISRENIIPIEMDQWHFKNINIWPSFPHPQTDFSEEIKIIKKNKELLRSIITDFYNLDDIEEAFKRLTDKKQDCIKILIKCNEVKK